MLDEGKQNNLSWQSSLIDTLRLTDKPVDVLFVTDQQSIPFHLVMQLEQKRFSWETTSVDEFLTQPFEPDQIATIVLDTSDVIPEYKEILCNTVRRFEQGSTATILLNNCIDFPLNNFKLVTLFETILAEEIIARIETNLKHRNRQTSTAPGNKMDKISDDITEQLKMASQLQNDFLPKSFPELGLFKWATYYKPADWVSGDIYDVQRLDEDHLGFYLADAVGHSMPAALLTIFIKQALVMRQTHGNTYGIFQPEYVVNKLNEKMCTQQFSGCSFATVCYFLLNTKTLELTYARGGHPYPVLIRDNQLIQLQSKGGLVGVFDSNEFQQQKVQLKSGDKLFVYSDGAEDIVGQCDQQQVFQYDKKFADLARLDINEMVNRFGDLAQARALNTNQIDDITAVGLQIL